MTILFDNSRARCVGCTLLFRSPKLGFGKTRNVDGHKLTIMPSINSLNENNIQNEVDPTRGDPSTAAPLFNKQPKML